MIDCLLASAAAVSAAAAAARLLFVTRLRGFLLAGCLLLDM